jgi:hypothetical protein
MSSFRISDKEKCTAAVLEMLYFLAQTLFADVEMLSEAAYAHEFMRAPVHKLFVKRYFVAFKLPFADHAIIFVHLSTNFAL